MANHIRRTNEEMAIDLSGKARSFSRINKKGVRQTTFVLFGVSPILDRFIYNSPVKRFNLIVDKSSFVSFDDMSRQY